MSKLNELRNQRNEAMRTAATYIQKAEVTKEDRSKFDEIMANVAVMEQDIARLEQVEKFEAEQRAIPQVPRPVPGAGAQGESAEERSAKQREQFRSFLMHEVPGFEKRDMTTANSSAVIPQAFYPVLIEAKKAWGGVANLVNTKRSDNGAPMKLALSNDTANGLILPGEQGANLTEVDVPFSNQISQVDEVSTGIIKISWAELADSFFDFDGLVRNYFGKRYARGLAQMITAGNGSNVASLKSGATTGATSASGAAISYVDLKNVYGALDPAYEQSATWCMNSTTRAFLMGVEDTLGRPIFIPNPSTGAFDQLFGRPVVLNQYLDNIADNKIAVQYGDFSQGYMLCEVGDLLVVRLNERFADQLSTGFLGYTRIGGNVTDGGTHPVVSLVQAAS